MKIQTTRFMTLILAMMMLLSAVSCAKSKDDTETTAPDSAGTNAQTEAETQFMPDIPKHDYHAELNVLGANSILKGYCFPSDDEEKKNDLDVTLHERAIQIEDHLGVKLVHHDAIWTEYSGTLRRLVQANDDSFQLVLTPCYEGIPALIEQNCLMNFADLPSVHLDAPYWSQNVMNSVKINDKYLLGYSDFLLSDVNLITFNKDMMKEYKMEEPYDLVRNKEWTLDAFLTMASGIYEDLNNDGKRDKEDKYSISGWGWVDLIDFVTCSDIQIVSLDESGTYHVAYNDQKEKMISLVEKIYNFYKQDSSFFWGSYGTDKAIRMDSGHSLFGMMPASTLISYRDSDVRLGILPYPMYNEEQDGYHTLNWNGYMCVPITVKDVNMVSDTLELINAYSEPVKIAFYEHLLGLKMSEAPDDSEMLKILWDTQISDIGLMMSNLGGMDKVIYLIPQMCETHRPNYASYMKTCERMANRSLQKFFDGTK